jgi:two-component system, cell cycle sensor histidine kinase and response regulator CckA
LSIRPAERRVDGRGVRVLYVDDEPMITQMASVALDELGFKVVARNSSTEALALFQSAPDDFDVIVTDQTMPELTGLSLARLVLSLRPRIPVILATGYSEVATAETAETVGIRDFITKPLNMKDMATRILAVVPSLADPPEPSTASRQPAGEGRAVNGTVPRA